VSILTEMKSAASHQLDAENLNDFSTTYTVHDADSAPSSPGPSTKTPSTLKEDFEDDDSWPARREGSAPGTTMSSAAVDDSLMDIEEELAPAKKGKALAKGKAKATPNATATRTTRGRSVSRAPSSRAASVDPDFDESLSVASSRPTRRTAAPRKASQKKAALFLSDSEDEATQSGRVYKINEDDEDDGETFDFAAVEDDDSDSDDEDRSTLGSVAATVGSRSTRGTRAGTQTTKGQSRNIRAPPKKAVPKPKKRQNDDSDDSDGAFGGF
jgi:hypothetical protein